jgi:hypothetical protein
MTGLTRLIVLGSARTASDAGLEEEVQLAFLQVRNDAFGLQ